LPGKRRLEDKNDVKVKDLYKKAKQLFIRKIGLKALEQLRQLEVSFPGSENWKMSHFTGPVTV